ncbi:MAG: type III pantothenate kinase [Bacteroidales bacterium]|nr:type III pantothenate kinase [Bacteroidales bacterium]
MSKKSGTNEIMYNLCIDQGNSSTKIGIFKQDVLLESHVYEILGVTEISEIISRHSVNSCILSSVIANNNELINYLESTFVDFILLNDKTPVPVINRYATPQTLGKDRLAAVIGAAYLQPETDLLVVDAGTSITYDFIDAQKVYRGGNIAPGIDMRLRSLHEFTQKLPLVKAENNSPLLGTDTQSAILSGVLYGIVFEINGYIDALKIKYPELSTFLTGGSTFYFDTKLKNPIFAEKNLVLIGLNRILQFNVQK